MCVWCVCVLCVCCVCVVNVCVVTLATLVHQLDACKTVDGERKFSAKLVARRLSG